VAVVPNCGLAMAALPFQMGFSRSREARRSVGLPDESGVDDQHARPGGESVPGVVGGARPAG